MPSFATLRGFAWYLWQRSRWALGLTTLTLLISACVLALWPATPPEVKTGFVLFITAGLLALLGLLALSEPSELGSVQYPRHLFLLPLSDSALVLGQMTVSLAFIGLPALVFGLAVLAPIAGARHAFWPAAVLTGSFSLWQASSCLPFRHPFFQAFACMFPIAAVVLGPVCILMGVPQWIVCASYIALIPPGALLSVYGVRRSRHLPPTPQRIGRNGPKANRDRVFNSPMEAQIWFEGKRNGMVANVIGFTFLILLLAAAVTIPLSSDIVNLAGREASIVAVCLAACLLGLPWLIAFMGCCGSSSDNVAKDQKMLPFLALRPLSTPRLLEAKMRMAIRLVLGWALLSLVCACAILLVPSPAMERSGPTLFVIAHAVGPTEAAGYFILYLAFLLGCVKGVVSNIWVQLGGLSPAMTTAFAIAILAPFVLVLIGGVHILVNPDHIPWVLHAIPYAMWAYLALKMTVAVPAIGKIRENRLLSDRFIATWLGCCAVGGLTLFIALKWAVPPEYAASATIAAQILCLAPIARMALTPVLVHANRHR